jgi:hypothetical protein
VSDPIFSRWISVLRDDPVLFIALVMISFGGAWWQKAVLDKAVIEGLKEQVKAKDSLIAVISQHLSFAQEREKDYFNTNVRLRTEIDRLFKQIEQGAPNSELAVTFKSVQSSISKLTVAHTDISFAIRNSTACIEYLPSSRGD